MADECTDSSVATSSASTPSNWWDSHNHNHQYHHGSSVSGCLGFYNSQWSHQNPNSNSSCDEDVCNHSGLTLDSSNHLLPWTQVLLNIGNGVELESNDGEMGEKFLEGISSKNISTTGIFEPVASCSDYLKKMEMDTNNLNSWDMSTVPAFNNNGLMVENERLLKLSNLVNTWSIALPSPEAAHLGPGFFFSATAAANNNNTNNNNNNGFHNPFYGMQQVDNADNCNFPDYISFNGRLPKPVINVHAPNPSAFNKHIHQTSSSTRISGRGSGVSSEGKKKRSEESSETATKKTKQENSTALSNKMQQPKVKIGDRITALQQIVSPFGKTDTASVLTETIGYIKFLQEQVQLLSNPYMKTNSYKDPWQSLERKDSKVDGKIDLRSRGLCLVPISCTPQVYRENTGSDYWTPYRGCFYR